MMRRYFYRPSPSFFLLLFPLYFPFVYPFYIVFLLRIFFIFFVLIYLVSIWIFVFAVLFFVVVVASWEQLVDIPATTKLLQDITISPDIAPVCFPPKRNCLLRPLWNGFLPLNAWDLILEPPNKETKKKKPYLPGSYWIILSHWTFLDCETKKTSPL